MPRSRETLVKLIAMAKSLGFTDDFEFFTNELEALDSTNKKEQG